MDINIHAHAKNKFLDDIEAGEVKIKRTMFDRFDVFKVYGTNQKGASFEVNIYLDRGQDIDQAVYYVGDGKRNIEILNQNAIDGKPSRATG